MVHIFFLLALYSSVSIAQEFYQISDIHVSEEEEVLSIISENSGPKALVQSEDIEQLQAGSLDDLFKSTSGVTTVGGPRSSAEKPQIRGLESSKIVIYVDGVKQNFRMRHNGIVLVDPADLKQVEVFKSSATALRGGGGLGGGIYFTTKDPKDYLSFGQNRGASLKISHEDAGSEKSSALRVYGQVGKSDLLFSHNKRVSDDLTLSNGVKLEKSAFEDQALSLKVVRKIGSSQLLKIGADYYERKDRIPLNPTLEVGESDTDLTVDNVSKKNSFNLSHQLTPDSNSQINLYSNIYFNKQIIQKTRISDSRLDLREVKTYGGSFYNNFFLGKRGDRSQIITVGSEFLVDENSGSRDGVTLPSFPGGSGKSFGSYLQFKGDVGDKFSYTPSLRYDWYKLNSNNHEHPVKSSGVFSKKLALAYTPVNWLKLFSNYSEGFNAPRLQDMYVDGLHYLGDDFLIPDNYFVPNPNLEHETSESLEAGVELSFDQILDQEDYLSLSFSIYQNDYADYITFLKDDFGSEDEFLGTTQFVNIPKAKIWGHELSLNYIYKMADLNLSYEYSRGLDRSLGEHLELMPADKFTLNLKFLLEDQGLSFGYLGVKTLKQDRINYGAITVTDPTPQYTIHGFFLNKTFSKGLMKDIDVAFRIDNLENLNYRKHASNMNEVGRNFKISLGYKL